MAQLASSSTGDTLVPLPQWVEGEDREQITSSMKILHKTTVAYGISELVRHSRAYPPGAQTNPTPSVSGVCDVHNFAIRISQGSGKNDVVGVDMISPRLSVNIVEPPFLRGGDGDQGDGVAGRYLEAELTARPENDNGAVSSGAMFSQSEEDARCHSLGILLYGLFSPQSRRGVAAMQYDFLFANNNANMRQEKKMRLHCLASKNGSSVAYPGGAVKYGHTQKREPQTTTSLLDLGFSASVSLLVQNLIECGDEQRPEHAYDSLDGAIQDLHLLLLDPTRFLFDRMPPLENGAVQPSFRTHKLYGREEEVSSITEAFCRVSCGKSEAFFVEGFSGSGKSRLVNSLTARIDVANGYVIAHKFDQMSKGNQLLEIISAFNDLCRLVRKKRTPREIDEISAKLMDTFGEDLSILAQLLPNIQTLSPKVDSAIKKDLGDKMNKGNLQSNSAIKELGDEMNKGNLQSICFLLRRFMTVVSSSENPVMLFWDDLQWSELPSLTVVEEILTAATGSNCLFFVGSYRNNEIPDDHALFPFMKRLTSSGVPTTTLRLEGLDPTELNVLVSDALCMFPRICRPLSDIVFKKTQGNPFFSLALMSEIVDKKLLEYSFSKRCWVWDEDHISSMDIADNVLELLSSRMSSFSQDVQLALKVASCFGSKINSVVWGCLGSTSLCANIQAPGVKNVVFGEGFLVRDGTSGWKWVHDKVREAAYSLIPGNEKNQLHFRIGMAMYTITKQTTCIDEIVFDVADQINKGLNEAQSPELRYDLAVLNEMAGTKAARYSDYVASRSYFDIALSLLPPNHWESHYDTSLQLYFLSATSTYSCGDGTKAIATLQRIICQARCLQDKLKSYYRLMIILYHSNRARDSYATACDVLSQLGEVIPRPDAIGEGETKEKLKATSQMLSCVTKECLQNSHTPPTMESRTKSILEFYSILTLVCFGFKPDMTILLVHRMVQLSINHCSPFSIYSVNAIMHFCAMVCYTNRLAADIQESCRIAKLAMKAFQKFDVHTDLGHIVFGLYYRFIAPMTEPLQLCADNLQRGFESGMARGDRAYALVIATHVTLLSFLAGGELTNLFKQCEYYLDVVSKYRNGHAKIYLSSLQNTISTIIGQRIDSNFREEALNTLSIEEMNYNKIFHEVMKCFWLGQTERCHYFAEQIIDGKAGSHSRHNKFIMHYYGLNSLKMITASGSRRKNTSKKLKEVPKKCLRELKQSYANSRLTFRNKVHLLEADIFSFEGSGDEAKASYVAAIESAQCSNFIHEQGLAWELFGVHYTKIGDRENARNMFHRAKQCYSQWGSKVKVDYITHQIDLLEIATKPS